MIREYQHILEIAFRPAKVAYKTLINRHSTSQMNVLSQTDLYSQHEIKETR